MELDQYCEINADFWKNKKVFLTGHSGFKGSWLSIWLNSLGANVKGFSLQPSTTPSLFNEAKVSELIESEIGDIRNFNTLSESLLKFNPEIIIHMAAQPLVRLSYIEPVMTYDTNVMGTVNLLEAARGCSNLKVILNVTTDKCYLNREWSWGYRENEQLGGYDPYSSSKACSELVTSAYRSSFFEQNGIAVATARSGNVIGGGDWSNDRLIPDILRTLGENKSVVLRNPQSIRPWQHVLEPLSGYLLLVEKLYNEGQIFADAWNFGPNDSDVKTVEWIVNKMIKEFGNDANWQLESSEKFHEANLLKLDISKAKEKMNWSPRWNLSTALEKIIEWHNLWLNNCDVQKLCIRQIVEFQQSSKLN